MLKIDEYCFEKYFHLFKLLVESESKSVFVSFPSNRYTEENEGYKDVIYEIARKKLNYWNWKIADIDSGEIFKAVYSAVKLENNQNNLVNWRIIDKFQELEKNNILNEYEKALFDFYHGLITDEESFNAFLNYFGKNYSLLAYLFFIKDKAQYLPIGTSYFDVAFKKLGVQNFKTSKKCAWDNYSQYIGLINQVKDLLISKGIKDVSLLNAHSFVWIISEVEEKLNELGISKSEEFRKIQSYKELSAKDKETVIKARIGQGLFRNYLKDYWKKCSVSGCDNLNILIASHIKPWSECDIKEAIDPYNGLLLAPNLDKLFDLGLISFDDNGKILISSKLSPNNMMSLAVNNVMRLCKIDDKHKRYIAYHRERVFNK